MTFFSKIHTESKNKYCLKWRGEWVIKWHQPSIAFQGKLKPKGQINIGPQIKSFIYHYYYYL